MQRCTCNAGMMMVTVDTGSGLSMHELLTCVDCNGSGFLTETKAAQIKRAKELWCQCGNPSGSTMQSVVGTAMTCWDCADCGGVIQIG